MSAELSASEIKVLKALVNFISGNGGGKAAPAAEHEPEPETEKVVIDEDKLGDMEIEQIREFAESIGMEGYKKMGRKDLIAAILEFGSGGGGDSADAAAEQPAGKGKKGAAVAPKWKAGDVVAAKWYDDGQWYEAKVLDVEDAADTGKIKLKFIADQIVQQTKLADIKPKE